MHLPLNPGASPNRHAPWRSRSIWRSRFVWLMLGVGVVLTAACADPARDCEADSQCAETVAPPGVDKDAGVEAGPKDKDRDASVVARSDAAVKSIDASTTTTKPKPTTKDSSVRDAGLTSTPDTGVHSSTTVVTGESDVSVSSADSTSTSEPTSESTSSSNVNTSPRRLANIGQACAEARDCRSGQCFTELDSEGSFSGWSEGACFDDCTETEECPTGSACVSFGVVAYCLASCDSHDDCREDYACYPTEPSICLPDCRFLTEGCGEGYVCSADGACEPEPAPG